MKKKVLVAEDDQAILEVMKIILENEGYATLETDSREVIHKMAAEENPDLILLDIWLSGHDGGKIAKDLKSKKKTKHIPIVMVSASNETEKISLSSGADGFLLKPFNIEDLISVVHKHSR